ncbi:dihydropteroate synthase [Conexibacter sp. DBS9H8]|uniref:dihydropteroate synthase n=1 Tax=Conexibacter sp. DBS9H8 TaxID=2937801 RepID=UPI00200EE69B|nr:dihydropteroate synthase [Conexibacter sp. DBS9H8]
MTVPDRAAPGIAPQRELAACGARLRFGGAPALMGIVNATPDSFSDQGLERTLEARVQRARDLVAAGASVIDIGGESGSTDTAAVGVEEEIERVVPVIAAVSALGVTVSVDTYKPAVAAAAVTAGARIVNDVSALADPELADVCAQTGAALILMHTRAAPKHKLLDRGYDGRMAADVRALLGSLIETAIARGVQPEQLMLDPGPDFGKTPAQTVEALRDVRALHDFGRPLLAAISRKDFIGAITGRPPTERLAGTLAALAFAADTGMHLVRVHDVSAAADFLKVRAVLEGTADLAADAHLPDHLRRQR